MIEITVEGLDATLEQLDALEKVIVEASTHGAYLWSEGVMGESKKECPVDTGNLRSSGFVGMPENGEMLLIYPVEYGLYVHENLEAAHPTGKAKFLEDPVNRNLDKLPTMIEREIGRALKVSL